MNLLSVKKLKYSYPGKKDTLKGISFNIEEGKFVCMVGENGSGKSTIMKCILGLNKNYQGTIEKQGRIGYLPQKTDIQTNFPASIEEVVMSGTIANNIRSIFYKKDDKEKAKNIMQKLGIYEIRKKCFADLSGGQQQRVLIARAMCSAEKMIILDEPTNGLDPSISRQIYKMLEQLKKEHNLTILMVSHDIDRALKYADEVIEITDGKITYNGNTSEYRQGGAEK